MKKIETDSPVTASSRAVSRTSQFSGHRSYDKNHYTAEQSRKEFLQQIVYSQRYAASAS